MLEHHAHRPFPYLRGIPRSLAKCSNLPRNGPSRNVAAVQAVQATIAMVLLKYLSAPPTCHDSKTYAWTSSEASLTNIFSLPTRLSFLSLKAFVLCPQFGIALRGGVHRGTLRTDASGEDVVVLRARPPIHRLHIACVRAQGVRVLIASSKRESSLTLSWYIRGPSTAPRVAGRINRVSIFNVQGGHAITLSIRYVSLGRLSAPALNGDLASLIKRQSLLTLRQVDPLQFIDLVRPWK